MKEKNFNQFINTLYGKDLYDWDVYKKYEKYANRNYKLTSDKLLLEAKEHFEQRIEYLKDNIKTIEKDIENIKKEIKNNSWKDGDNQFSYITLLNEKLQEKEFDLRVFKNDLKEVEQWKNECEKELNIKRNVIKNKKILWEQEKKNFNQNQEKSKIMQNTKSNFFSVSLTIDEKFQKSLWNFWNENLEEVLNDEFAKFNNSIFSRFHKLKRGDDKIKLIEHKSNEIFNKILKEHSDKTDKELIQIYLKESIKDFKDFEFNWDDYIAWHYFFQWFTNEVYLEINNICEKNEKLKSYNIIQKKDNYYEYEDFLNQRYWLCSEVYSIVLPFIQKNKQSFMNFLNMALTEKYIRLNICFENWFNEWQIHRNFIYNIIDQFRNWTILFVGEWLNKHNNLRLINNFRLVNFMNKNWESRFFSLLILTIVFALLNKETTSLTEEQYKELVELLDMIREVQTVFLSNPYVNELEKLLSSIFKYNDLDSKYINTSKLPFDFKRNIV